MRTGLTDDQKWQFKMKFIINKNMFFSILQLLLFSLLYFSTDSKGNYCPKLQTSKRKRRIGGKTLENKLHTEDPQVTIVRDDS